jgi:hypothetical protein
MAAAAILWFLMATTGPRMDEGGPIAHPHSLAHFHTKAECEKKALEIVKENTLPGQVTTHSCASCLGGHRSGSGKTTSTRRRVSAVYRIGPRARAFPPPPA